MSPLYCSRWRRASREDQHGGTRERGKQRRSPSRVLSHADPDFGPYESQTMQGVDDHDYQVYTIYCQAIPEI